MASAQFRRMAADERRRAEPLPGALVDAEEVRMADRKDEEPVGNETLQSGADGDLAYGEDARTFGAGGQVIERAFDPGQEDEPHRDADRDGSLPPSEQPSRSER